MVGLANYPGDVASSPLAQPRPAGSWEGVRVSPYTVPALLSNGQNTAVITVLFQPQVQSTALCGLLQGKGDSSSDRPNTEFCGYSIHLSHCYTSQM